MTVLYLYMQILHCRTNSNKPQKVQTEKPTEEENRLSTRLLLFLKYFPKIPEHPALRRAKPGPRKRPNEMETLERD